MIQDLAYPIRMGANNDLQLCEGYDNNVEQSLRFILDNGEGTIAGFPEIGSPLEPFMETKYFLLVEDWLKYDLLQLEPRVKSIFAVKLYLGEDGYAQVDFDYITVGGSVNHFSTKWLRTVNDVEFE